MENQQELPVSADNSSLSTPPHRRRWPFGLLAACLVFFAGGYGVVRWTIGDGRAAVDPPAISEAAPQLFIGWAKPDFVLVITGQLHGYLQPCGCSDPQYGGLARRWEFINELTKKGWPWCRSTSATCTPKAPTRRPPKTRSSTKPPCAPSM